MPATPTPELFLMAKNFIVNILLAGIGALTVMVAVAGVVITTEAILTSLSELPDSARTVISQLPSTHT